MSRRAVLGLFVEAPAAAAAAAALRRRGFSDLGFYAPTLHPALEAAWPSAPSPVRRFTLTGGILGGLSGFALTIGLTLLWPRIVGGKPIISIPPFLVIVFELTILIAGLATLLGFLWSARLARPAREPYDPRVSVDRYGVIVRCAAEQSDQAIAALRELGCEEVVE